MPLDIKHTTVVTGTNDATKQVSKDAWNASLAANMATGRILGRGTAGAGPVEELALGTNLSISGGVLNAAGGAAASSGITVFNGAKNATATGVGTDDYPALQALIDQLRDAGGGHLHIPAGKYRISQRLVVTRTIHISGVGYGISNGTPPAVTGETELQTYFGTVLVYDAGIAGIILYDVGDGDNAAVVAAGPQSDRQKYFGAKHSVVEGILFYGGGGNNRAAHGYEVRSPFTTQRKCGFRNFSGDGIRVNGSSGVRTTPYGNVSNTMIDSAGVRANQGHGIWVEGNETSLVRIENADIARNGGCGYVSLGFQGETLVNSHCASNNASAPVAVLEFVGQKNHRAALVAELPLNPYDATTTKFLSMPTIPVANTQLQSQEGYTGSFYIAEAGTVLVGCYTENGPGEKGHAFRGVKVIGGAAAFRGNWTNESVVSIDDPLQPGGFRKLELGGLGGGPQINIDAGGNTGGETYNWPANTLRVRTDYAVGNNLFWYVPVNGGGTQNKAIDATMVVTAQTGDILTLNTIGNLKPGEFIKVAATGFGQLKMQIMWVNAPNKTIRVNTTTTVDLNVAVTYSAPVFVQLGGQAAAQADSTATTVAGVVADLNALLAKLRTPGLMAV